MTDKIRLRIFRNSTGATGLEFISPEGYVLRRELRPDGANYWWEPDNDEHPYFIFSDAIEIIDER